MDGALWARAPEGHGTDREPSLPTFLETEDDSRVAEGETTVFQHQLNLFFKCHIPNLCKPAVKHVLNMLLRVASGRAF